MKLLAIIGSPRKDGNTFAVVEKISDKLKSLGDIEIEYLFLSDINLELCKGCCSCFINGESSCPNKDDREMIEQKLLASDAVIFASPVYAVNMTALMKNFMDRFAYSMHRPRFFNQKTMIVAVTAIIGLKETINSMSHIKAMGFNITQTFGLIVNSPLTTESMTDTKTTNKIEKEAEKFYKKIISKKPIKPNDESVIQFRIQQKLFFKNKEELPYDWEYFASKGWFDPKRKHFIDNAKVSFSKNLWAKLFAKCI